MKLWDELVLNVLGDKQDRIKHNLTTNILLKKILTAKKLRLLKIIEYLYSRHVF